ncbi:hypothetical protein TNCT_3211 [Trichonephila clavata]|uniref:Uncharacterized protein n=1 Tax=Trichonephila clavata TaxID=2740835 RepID=A0A8X6KZ18_TRICU|nr:hypothetical protein TNCT_3211 [Trichonephila clavata]
MRTFGTICSSEKSTNIHQTIIAGFWKIIIATLNGLKAITGNYKFASDSLKILSESNGERDIDDNQAPDWSSSDD